MAMATEAARDGLAQMPIEDMYPGYLTKMTRPNLIGIDTGPELQQGGSRISLRDRVILR
jgi:hypothetical protein